MKSGFGMFEIIVYLLIFIVLVVMGYFLFPMARPGKQDGGGQAAPLSGGGTDNGLLSRYAKFEVHRTVANGVQLSDIVEAFGRASLGTKSRGVSTEGERPIGHASMGKWDVRISNQVNESRQKILYEANFNAPYIRLIVLIAGIFVFITLSDSLYVVDVLAGMRRGGVDVSGFIPEIIAWTVVVLLKFVAPMVAIMFAISPSLFARKNIEKIIDKSLREF